MGGNTLQGMWGFDGTGGQRFNVYQNVSNQLEITNNQGPILFDTNTGGTGIERMRITENGLVGIDTDTPQHKLQINNPATIQIGTYLGLTNTALNNTPVITFNAMYNEVNFNLLENIFVPPNVSTGAGSAFIWGDVNTPNLYFTSLPNVEGATGINLPNAFSSNLGHRQNLTILGETGYVGINTTAPMRQLDVSGNTLIRGNLQLGPVGDEGGELVITNQDGTGSFTLDSLGLGSNTRFRGNDFVINASTGYVGIGIEPTVRLDVNGTIRTNDKVIITGSGGVTGDTGTYQLQLPNSDFAFKTTTSTWYVGSDSRIKTNIQNADLNICYNNVKNIPLKYFKWNQDYITSNDIHSIGFLAQDIKVHFPNSVNIDVRQFENEIIEDFHHLNVDQINKCMFGALQKVIQDKEILENSYALLSHQNQTLSTHIQSLEVENQVLSNQVQTLSTDLQSLNEKVSLLESKMQ
jgi:hypothetical protein